MTLLFEGPPGLGAECLQARGPLVTKDGAGLYRVFPDLAPGPYQLVFFATWCVACEASLTQSKAENTILIGTMDEPEDIQNAYGLLGGGRPCLLDTEGSWFKALGGRELPFSTQVELQRVPSAGHQQ